MWWSEQNIRLRSSTAPCGRIGRCSRDTYPESYITKCTSIRNPGCRFGPALHGKGSSRWVGCRATQTIRLRSSTAPLRIDEHLEREFFIVNLLVPIHFMIEMIWWTGLAPWQFEFPTPESRLRR